MTEGSLQKREPEKRGWELEWNSTKERKFNRNKLFNFVLISFTLGLFAVFILGHKTLVPAMFISKVVAFCCVVGLLVPWSYYHRWFGWYKMDVLIVNIFGAGPFIAGMLLSLNFFIHFNRVEERYIIEHRFIERYDGAFGSPKLLLKLENDAYEDQKELILFDLGEIREGEIPQAITYTFADGLFGYRVVLDWEMEYPE